MVFAEGLLEAVLVLVELGLEAPVDFGGVGVAERDKFFPLQLVQPAPVLILLFE